MCITLDIMGLLKFVMELGKSVPTCKPIANTLKEITDSLKRNFSGARSVSLRQQIADASKDVQMTTREMERSVTKHKLDISDGPSNNLSFDQLIKDCSSMKDPYPVKSPYQPSSTTRINRYGQDGGYGNSNIGNLLGP